MTTAAEWIAATPTHQRMTQDELDAICDTIREAMYDDKALLPDLFWHGLSSLGVIASTGTEARDLATQTLRQMVQRAKGGVPMNERGEHL